jgi:hypothetical protein
VAGRVVDALDDVRGAVTEGFGDATFGAADDRAVEAVGRVVDALGDVRGTDAVTGGFGDATFGAAGDRAVEVENASLPTATPAPKRINAVNAIAAAAPAVRRRSTGPVGALTRGGAAGGGNGTRGAGATEAVGGSTSACAGTGAARSSRSARSLRSGETRTSSGLRGRSGSRSTIRRSSLGGAGIPTVNSTSVRRKRPPPCSRQQREVERGRGSNPRPSAWEPPPQPT